MAKRTQQIFQLARQAAISRIRVLRAEEDELVKLFHFTTAEIEGTTGTPERTVPPPPEPAKRRSMSQATRKAISKRMKALWAEARAGKRPMPKTGPKNKRAKLEAAA